MSKLAQEYITFDYIKDNYEKDSNNGFNNNEKNTINDNGINAKNANDKVNGRDLSISKAVINDISTEQAINISENKFNRRDLSNYDCNCTIIESEQNTIINDAENNKVVSSINENTETTVSHALLSDKVFIYNIEAHSEEELDSMFNSNFCDFNFRKIASEVYLKAFLGFLERDNPTYAEKTLYVLSPCCRAYKEYIRLQKENRLDEYNYNVFGNPFEYGCGFRGRMKKLAKRYYSKLKNKKYIPRLLTNYYTVTSNNKFVTADMQLHADNLTSTIPFNVEWNGMEDIQSIYSVSIEVDLHDIDISNQEQIKILEEKKNKIKEIVKRYDLIPTVAYTTNRSIYMQYTFDGCLTVTQAIGLKRFLIFRLFNELGLLADRNNLNPNILQHVKLTVHKSLYQENIVAPFKWQDKMYSTKKFLNYAMKYVDKYHSNYIAFWQSSIDKLNKWKVLYPSHIRKQLNYNQCKNYCAGLQYLYDYCQNTQYTILAYPQPSYIKDIFTKNTDIFGREIETERSIEYHYQYLKQQEERRLAENELTEEIFDIPSQSISKNGSYISKGNTNSIENYKKMVEFQLDEYNIASGNIKYILNKDITGLREIFHLESNELKKKHMSYSNTLKYIIQKLGLKMHLLFDADILGQNKKCYLHQVYKEKKPSMGFNIIYNQFADCEVEFVHSYNGKPDFGIVELFTWAFADKQLSFKDAKHKAVKFLANILNITIKSHISRDFNEYIYNDILNRLLNQYKERYINRRTKKSIAKKEMEDLQKLADFIMFKMCKNMQYSVENEYKIQHMFTTRYLSKEFGWTINKCARLMNQLILAKIFRKVNKNNINDIKLINKLNDTHNTPYVLEMINFKERVNVNGYNISRFKYAQIAIKSIFIFEKISGEVINRWNTMQKDRFNDFLPVIEEKEKKEAKNLIDITWKSINKFFIKNDIIKANITCNTKYLLSTNMYNNKFILCNNEHLWPIAITNMQRAIEKSQILYT